MVTRRAAAAADFTAGYTLPGGYGPTEAKAPVRAKSPAKTKAPVKAKSPAVEDSTTKRKTPARAAASKDAKAVPDLSAPTTRSRSKSPAKQLPTASLPSSMRSPSKSPAKRSASVSFAETGERSYRKRPVPKNPLAQSSDFPAIPENLDISAVVRTQVPARARPRDWWLQNQEQVGPPWIAVSSFVPLPIVEHLMRDKKPLAIGVKYEHGDSITNMEGAMHTFVTPIVYGWIHGSCEYTKKGHTIQQFELDGKYQQGMNVIISCFVHQDFEDEQVMMKLASLASKPTKLPGLFVVPSPEEKKSDKERAKYDEALRCWMVSHLTSSGELPSIQQACADDNNPPMTLDEVLDHLEEVLLSPGDIMEAVMDVFFWLNDPEESATGLPLLSLEVMVATAFHQIRNEFDALEQICVNQPYDYTFDPPVMFTRALNNEHLMPLVTAVAIKHYSNQTELKRMRIYAYNDFTNEGHLDWFKEAFSKQPNVEVMSKEEFCDGDNDSLTGDFPCVTVLHNNSHAFGQNVQFEKGNGRLDAVIGEYSSAAASLVATRADLLDHLAVHEK